MSIFISYEKKDRSKAKVLARVFQEKGWLVWWDRTLAPGQSFDSVIQGALRKARCVVVLWSRSSVSSNWVNAEAEEGRRRKILIPVQLGRTKPPLGFRQLQAAQLVGWPKRACRAEVKKLVAAVAAKRPTSTPTRSRRTRG